MPLPGESMDLSPGLLRAAVDASRLLILLVDARGQILLANQAVLRAAGWSAQEYRRPVWDLAALEHHRSLLRGLFTRRPGPMLPSDLLFHVGTDRALRAIDWDIQAVGDGPEPSFLFSGVDLSERRASERALRESGMLQRMILERIPAVIWTTDRQLRFTFSSGAGLAAWLSLSPAQAEALGTSLYGYFHTTDPGFPAIAAHLKALRGEGSVYQTEWQGRLFETRVEPLGDPQHGIIGCIGLSIDITDRERTLQALQQSESRLRRLVDSNLIGISFFDARRRALEANEACLGLVGFTEQDLQSGALSWANQTPPEYASLDERALAEIRASGKCTPYEKELFTKDRRRIPVLVGAAALELSPERELRTGVAFMIDLREQVRLRKLRDTLLIQERQAREETEVANARLRLVVEGSERLARTMRTEDALAVLAELAVPHLADWSYVVHRGRAGEPALVATAHKDPKRQQWLQRLRDCRLEPSAASGAASVFRTGKLEVYQDILPQQLFPSGDGCPLFGTRDPTCLQYIRQLGMRSLLCVPIAGRDGVDAVLMLVSSDRPGRYGDDDVLLARNLADRASASLENARLLSEALESVRVRQEFLSVAAHELRTPLTALLLQVQILLRAAAAGTLGVGNVVRGLKTAETHARRLAGLIDRLMDVTRLANSEMTIRPEVLDMVQLVRALLAMMAGELRGARCEVRLDAPERLWGQWDRIRTEQVLTNLLSNAMKFGPGRPIEVQIGTTDGLVRVSVRDHGIGISSEDQARIFGRFERAVSVRHFGGLGLGLYISAQILRAHHGSLRVESEPGKGACFTVELPRWQEAALESPAP